MAEKCMVCECAAVTYNEQELPMCKRHAEHEALNLKCPLCGDYLDVLKGKYGTFFSCLKCGNLSRHKLKEHGNVFFVKKRQDIVY